MNTTELITKINESCKKQIDERLYITAADCLLDVGFITIADYEAWEDGKIEYLEKICRASTQELSQVLNSIRNYAKEERLKSTQLPYNGINGRLYFSKRKQDNVECAYRTIYMDPSLKKRDIQ